MTTVMEQVGWPVTRLEGGYQTWRRTVAAALHDLETAPPLKLVLLDGLTGSGKTEVLARLAITASRAWTWRGWRRIAAPCSGAPRRSSRRRSCSRAVSTPRLPPST
jgi:hypothetical protein